MAKENQDGQEQSEEPTGKRLSDARNKGQIARSKDFVTMAMMISGSAALLILGPGIADGLWEMMRDLFSFHRDDLFSSEQLVIRLAESIAKGFGLVSPLLLVMLIVSIVASGAIGGYVFTWEPMTPKLNKFNVFSGLKRMFGLKGLMELAKSLGKFLLIVGGVIMVLWSDIDDVLGMHDEELSVAAMHAFQLVGWSFLLISCTLILLALIDVPFQVWNHKRNLKMTKQEVKEERKNSDGNPEIKSRIRRLQYQMAYARMMEEVPKADVVVTNPTHYAVAIKYDQDKMNAPILLAKGADLMAQHIRRVAQQNDVPVLELPPLARSLYYTTEIGQPIPSGLYLAVAKLLAYIFQLKAAKSGRADYPGQLGDLPIPEELRH